MENIKNEGVSIITCTIRPHFMNRVFENYANQTWENKELIIILNRYKMNIEEWKEKAGDYPHVTVYQLNGGTSLGDCMNYAIDHAKFDFVAKFDDDDYYAPNYLQNAMKTFHYTHSDIVGKYSTYIYLERYNMLVVPMPIVENRFVHVLAGATLIIKKNVFRQVRFPSLTVGEDSHFLRVCAAKGFKMYATDINNYCTIRRTNTNDHTYKISDYEILKNSQIITRTSNFRMFVDS